MSITFSVTNWSWIGVLIVKATSSAKTLNCRYARESAISTQALVDRCTLINCKINLNIIVFFLTTVEAKITSIGVARRINKIHNTVQFILRKKCIGRYIFV